MKIAVVGAGNAGVAVAADLSSETMMLPWSRLQMQCMMRILFTC